MCSVLLVFLIFYIVFEFVHDSAPDWHPTSTAAPSTCTGTQSVVSTSQGYLYIDPQRRQRALARRAWFLHRKGISTLTHFALQKLLRTLAAHHSKDQSLLRRIHRHLKMEEELWPWRCTRCQRINRKNALKCAICQAYWTSGTRHSTQPKPKNAASPEWEEWSQQWDASQDAWNWEDHAQSRSQSRSSAHSMHSAHSGTSVQSEGKGKRRSRGKGKGKESHKKGQKKGKGPAKDRNATLASSPFAPLTAELPPWPPMDSAVTNQMPVILPAQQATQSPMENIAQKKEVVQALKAAYPEISQAPQETRDLIDKMEKDIEQLEKENNKSTTKNLHASTKALGKAQKTLTETLEAKRTHRLRWTKHVAEAAKSWESQLHEYRQQQAALQEIAAKARQDIETARNAIQTLSAGATAATLASMPPITAVSAEQEDGLVDIDQEAETVQQQLQTVLQSCAASLGVDLTSAPLPTTATSEMVEEDMEKSHKKRRSALEPFGGAGGATSSPLDGQTM